MIVGQERRRRSTGKADISSFGLSIGRVLIVSVPCLLRTTREEGRGRILAGVHWVAHQRSETLN